MNFALLQILNSVENNETLSPEYLQYKNNQAYKIKMSILHRPNLMHYHKTPM